MQIEQNISLKLFNTFGIDVTARQFAKFTAIDDLVNIFDLEPGRGKLPPLIIGGGSNILLTHNFDGLVAKNEMGGIEVIGVDEQHIYVRAGAGENWHKFVMNCLDNNFAGLENLSLIPGNVGAAPMQNIGAYGVEMKDVFHELEAFHIGEKKLEVFNGDQCEFGYRESVFKTRFKGQYIITSVTFKLNKQPVFNTSYGAIKEELDRMHIKELSIRAVSQAVINIRRSKLPDPAEIGNAGSFFKNPTISKNQFLHLKEEHPAIVGYPMNENEVKIAAGWLIERCGWKGYRKGDAGCHSKQALVLVNYGTATGNEIYDLSKQIIASVESSFGITLEREVNVF